MGAQTPRSGKVHQRLLALVKAVDETELEVNRLASEAAGALATTLDSLVASLRKFRERTPG